MKSLVLLRSAAAPTRGDLATERDTLLVSFHTCKDTNLGIANEVHNDHGPAWMRRNRIIKLVCKGTKGRETGPRNGWEIMVLVVISHLISRESVNQTMCKESGVRYTQEC